jgi:hypothetical protein
MEGGNVIIFSNKNSNGYENMVRRRLAQEGINPDSFELSERPWGTRVPGMPIVEHQGKQYLEVIFLRPGKVTYLVDRKPVEDPSTIPGLDLDKDEGEQGGLPKERKVHPRCFNVQNIFRIKIDGVEFTDPSMENT